MSLTYKMFDFIGLKRQTVSPCSGLNSRKPLPKWMLMTVINRNQEEKGPTKPVSKQDNIPARRSERNSCCRCSCVCAAAR